MRRRRMGDIRPIGTEKPQNPYRQGSQKHLIAEQLLAGEVDRDKIARELGVDMHTIYQVTSDLRKPIIFLFPSKGENN